MEAVALAAIAGGIGASFGVCWCAKKIYDHVITVNAIRDAEREGWTHIGTVKFMCIYPVDGGRGMEVEIANFGRNGFQSIPVLNENKKAIHHDRCYVVHNVDFQPYTAILNDPRICSSSEGRDMIENLWDQLRITVNTFELLSATRSIQYLNRVMRVKLPNSTISNRAELAYNIKTDNNRYEIGFCAPDRRVDFNTAARRTLELYGDPDCHLPNFTSCTMVNSRSIAQLKRGTRRVNLSHKNFRPQIVFEGKRPYIEENVRSIKIGNLEFHNVRPCTHGESINLNYEPERNAIFWLFAGRDNYNQIDPFTYLSRHRPLSRVGNPPYQNSTNPVFGINFHFEPPMCEEVVDVRDDVMIDEDAIMVDADAIMVDADEVEVVDVRPTQNPAFFTIVKGYQVYAKYNPPRSHPDAEEEMAF